MAWTPEPLPLGITQGLPFTYSPASISAISNTEAFDTGIDKRDNKRCIVCGHSKRHGFPLVHCHIVPKIEDDRWDFLKEHNLIPMRSKSAEHERNGILMCPNHHSHFDGYNFYIRWVPSSRAFVLINHSRTAELEPYHGRKVRLYPDDARVPFHSAFLDQEMRVRGHWPYMPFYNDRPVAIPFQWQAWIQDAPASTDGGGHDDGGDDQEDFNTNDKDGGNNEVEEMRDDLEKTISPDHAVFQSNPNLAQTKHARTKASVQTGGPTQLIMTFSNPFANPSELEAIMRSSREQPNWKAAEIEGESWEGTAEENILKYQSIMNPPSLDWPKVVGDLTGTGGD